MFCSFDIFLFMIISSLFAFGLLSGFFIIFGIAENLRFNLLFVIIVFDDSKKPFLNLNGVFILEISIISGFFCSSLKNNFLLL